MVFANWKYVSPMRTSCNYPTNAVSKYLKFTTFFETNFFVLLSSTIVHLSMAVVVNLCAGMSFLVVSNMALVCDMSSHYEKLDDVWKVYKMFVDYYIPTLFALSLCYPALSASIS